MRIRTRFIIGAGLIVAAIGYLIVTAIQNTSEFFMTVDEAGARRAQLEGQAFRIAGRVKAGTIAWDPASLTLTFAIAAIPEPSRENVRAVAARVSPSFNVVCKGRPKPDMFAAGRDVIVEGRLGANGVINATQVMTSCPSKYRPEQGQSGIR